jgi:hypothetical protein
LPFGPCLAPCTYWSGQSGDSNSGAQSAAAEPTSGKISH